MVDDDRNLRVSDFEMRADPEAVVLLGEDGGAYIPIHPFADDLELLARLQIKAHDCRSVDAYWRVGGDVCFLQVWLAKDDALGRRGFFARWADGEPPMLNLVAVVNAQAVSRHQFEDVMRDFLRLGVPSNPPFGKSLGDRLTPIGTT